MSSSSGSGSEPSSSSASSSSRGAPVPVPESSALPSAGQLKEAIKAIRPVEDLKTLPTRPCTRESLLYGIGTGAAIGGVRLFSTRVPVAANWAVGTFIFVSGTSWYICQKAKEAEARAAEAFVKKFPERNMRVAQKRAELAKADREAAASGSANGRSSSGADEDDENGGPRSNAPNDVLPERPSQFGETLSRAWPGGRDVASDSDAPNPTSSPGPGPASGPKNSGWWPFGGR